MTNNTVETDLRQQLETSTIDSTSNSKQAADLLKAQANEAFKSKSIIISNEKKNQILLQIVIMRKLLISIQKQFR